MPDGDRWDNLMATQFSVDGIGIRAVKTVLIDFREAKTILGMGPVLFVLRLGKMHFFSFCLHFAHALTLCRGGVKGDREVNFSQIPFKINNF